VSLKRDRQPSYGEPRCLSGETARCGKHKGIRFPKRISQKLFLNLNAPLLVARFGAFLFAPDADILAQRLHRLRISLVILFYSFLHSTTVLPSPPQFRAFLIVSKTCFPLPRSIFLARISLLMFSPRLF